MLEFWFIRHGESETNAGLPSNSDAITPLTDKGILQAEFVSQFLKSPPDLFVTSPYYRTEQTAQPTLEKFPGVPVETWPIHEFSYLGHEQYAGTNKKARRKLAENFFRIGDPDEILGLGGESFNQFVSRVETTFLKLLSYGKEHDRIILFGHGWFIRASLWLLDNGYGKIRAESDFFEQIEQLMPINRLPLKIDQWVRRRRKHKRMHSFLFFSGGITTPNCSIARFRINSSGEFGLSGFSVDHLPKVLRKTTMRNR